MHIGTPKLTLVFAGVSSVAVAGKKRTFFAEKSHAASV
jgi:hypothetical protein